MVSLAALGLLLGLRYRVPALAILTAAAVAVTLLLRLRGGEPVGAALLAGLIHAASLQAGYLVGVLIARRPRNDARDKG
jgi:hypothetical protein